MRRMLLCATVLMVCSGTMMAYGWGRSEPRPSPHDRGFAAGKAVAREATTDARKEYLRLYSEGLLAGLGEDRGGGNSYKLGGETVSTGTVNKLVSASRGFRDGVDTARRAESDSDRSYQRGYSRGIYEILGDSRTISKLKGG